MRFGAAPADTVEPATASDGADGQRRRMAGSLPKSGKRRTWWPFRRQEPDIALRLLAVHMREATPRR